MEKYSNLFKKAINDEVEISNIDDLVKEFPDYYNNIDFLEIIGRKLFFEGFKDKSLIFLMSIPNEKIIGYDLYILAIIHYSEENYLEAESFFQEALLDGYTRSYYWLGYIAEAGLIKEKDVNKARSHYKSGAECGYLMASRAYLRANLKLESGQQDYSKTPLYFRFVYKLKIFLLLIKAIAIALRDISDERLADIPNPMKKSNN